MDDDFIRCLQYGKVFKGKNAQQDFNKFVEDKGLGKINYCFKPYGKPTVEPVNIKEVEANKKKEGIAKERKAIIASWPTNQVDIYFVSADTYIHFPSGNVMIKKDYHALFLARAGAYYLFVPGNVPITWEYQCEKGNVIFEQLEQDDSFVKIKKPSRALCWRSVTQAYKMMHETAVFLKGRVNRVVCFNANQLKHPPGLAYMY